MTINGSTNSNNWTFKLEAYEIGNYDITNNTSTVQVDMYLGRANSRSYLGGNWSGSITVEGSTQYLNGKIPYPTYINAGEWLYLGTRSYTVTHNTDGTKVASISASMSSSEFTPSSAWASGNLTLTTIPRASSVTATNTDIGSATSININRASSSFKHTLKYNFGSLSGTIATNVDTSYGWTIPTTFYAEIPNSKTGTCTITCETYSGSTLIGTKTTTFVVTANENLSKPILTASIADINQDTIDLTGDNEKLIKYHSTAQITYTATSQNSSTITKVTINDVEVTNSPYNIENVVSSSFIIKATDSRGYVTTVTLTPDMIDYVPLTNSPSFYRTAPTTGEMSLEFSGNYFNDTFGDVSNTLSIKWYYKLRNDENWITGGTLVLDTDYKIVNNTYHSGHTNYERPISLGNSYDYQKQYDFKIEIEDVLEQVVITQSVSKGQPIVNWDDDHFNINGDITQYEQPFSGGGGGETLSVGTILEYPASSNLPSGWMICDGSAISRSEYSQLFNIIGTSFGSGDGSTTFNIPNKKGRISVGVDSSQTEFDTIGKTGGSKYLQRHSHTEIDWLGDSRYPISLNQSGSTGYHITYWEYGAGAGRMGTNEAGTGDSGNLQPYIVSNFIIKVSQTSGTNGQIVDNLDGNSTTDAPSQRAVNARTLPQWCVATQTTSQSVSSSSTVNLNRIQRQHGDFVLQNGGVKIPSGMSRVRVCAAIFIDNWPGGTNYLWGKIYNNGYEWATTINGSPSSFLSASIPPTVIEVQEGDIITLIADSPSGGRTRSGITNTWLYIEKIE